MHSGLDLQFACPLEWPCRMQKMKGCDADSLQGCAGWFGSTKSEVEKMLTFTQTIPTYLFILQMSSTTITAEHVSIPDNNDRFLLLEYCQ